MKGLHGSTCRHSCRNRDTVEILMLQQPVVHSRRFTSRVETRDVWVYCSADGREDTARVRNLSLGGLFMQTSVSKRWIRCWTLIFSSKRDGSVWTLSFGAQSLVVGWH